MHEGWSLCNQDLFFFHLFFFHLLFLFHLLLVLMDLRRVDLLVALVLVDLRRVDLLVLVDYVVVPLLQSLYSMRLLV